MTPGCEGQALIVRTKVAQCVVFGTTVSLAPQTTV